MRKLALAILLLVAGCTESRLIVCPGGQFLDGQVLAYALVLQRYDTQDSGVDPLLERSSILLSAAVYDEVDAGNPENFWFGVDEDIQHSAEIVLLFGTQHERERALQFFELFDVRRGSTAGNSERPVPERSRREERFVALSRSLSETLSSPTFDVDPFAQAIADPSIPDVERDGLVLWTLGVLHHRATYARDAGVKSIIAANLRQAVDRVGPIAEYDPDMELAIAIYRCTADRLLSQKGTGASLLMQTIERCGGQEPRSGIRLWVHVELAQNALLPPWTP